MADLNDLKNHLQQLREAVEAKLPDIATTLAMSGKALAERHIKDAGFGFMYRNQAYINKRSKRGLQNKFVDLSFENRMFSNMQPVRVDKNGQSVVAYLGATNVEDQAKMNYNFQRFGPFIQKALGESDQELLTQVVAREVDDVIQQFKP